MTHNLPNPGLVNEEKHSPGFLIVGRKRQNLRVSTQDGLRRRGPLAKVERVICGRRRGTILRVAKIPAITPELAPSMSRRDQLLQMLQENPDDTFLLYALAMDERATGNDQAALAGYDRVLGVDARYVAAYFQKGQILAGLERHDSAREVLREGIRVANEVGDAHAAGEMNEFLATLG